MKKFLALGFLGISHACIPATELCVEDSTGTYISASGKTITNLVLTKIVSGDSRLDTNPSDIGKYGVSDCGGSPKEWGTRADGNVVECEDVYSTDGGLTDNNLATGLIRKLMPATDIHRIELAAMCDSMDSATECTGNSFTGTLIPGAICADTTCVSSDKGACCLECTGDYYVDEDTSTCKTGIGETGETLKFKSLSVLKNARTNDNDAQSRLNAFFTKLQKKYIEGGRSIFGKLSVFSATDLEDTRKSLNVGTSIKYSRVKKISGEDTTLKRRTFGRNKKSTADAAKLVPMIVEEDEHGVVDVFEFGMEHQVVVEGDDIKDYQAFQINIQGGGNITTVCNTKDAIGGVECTVKSRRRLDGRRLGIGIESCYQGGSVTYDSVDNVYTFDSASIEFNWQCAVKQVGAEFAISHCATGTDNVQSYSRIGEWDSYSAQLVCSLCPSGSGVKSGTGGPSAQCEVCDSDTTSPYTMFNSKLDDTACDDCPAHSTSSAVGEYKSCVCKHGWKGDGYTTSPAGSGGCVQCLPGTYDDDGDPTTSCVTCDPGSITNTGTSAGATMCTPCAAGSFSSSPTTSCATCGAGSVTNTGTSAGARTCIPCAAGSFSSSPTTSCATCGAGSITNTGTSAGATSCVTCDPGSITNSGTSAGATTCTQCVTGKYSSSSNVASCSTCDPGSITNTGTSAGATTCTPCVPGLYSSSSDVASCSTCVPGSITNSGTSAGATTCTPCTLGLYSLSSNVAACSTCAKGTYNDDVGAAACKSCTVVVNGYSTVPGLTTSADCKDCSGFSTEWINSQCCGKSSSDNDWSDHCGILDGQCGVSC